jgi:hypothetical protein
MNRATVIGLSAVAWIAAAGCFRQEVRTFEIRVPQMRTPAAAELVTRTLRAFDTNVVSVVAPDTARQIVTVTYHSERAARRNFERALAVAGFDANDLRADPARKAQLPAEMQ